MNQHTNGWIATAIAWWVTFVSRHPLLVISLSIIVIASSLQYTADNLKINTDTSNLLSAELPFRKAYLQYEKAFPQHINTFIVVIDGETPTKARNAAKLLAAKIKTEKELIENVYTPKLGEFFDRNALLYLAPPELDKLVDRLSTLQPFLAKLTSDQSLRGLLAMLGSAFEATLDGEQVDLKSILTELNLAFSSAANDETYHLSWQEMMQGDSTVIADKRQIIVVKPKLDFSDLQPAEPSIKKVRQLIKDLDITAGNGLNARLTGLLALEYEELQSVKHGGIMAAVLSLTMAVIALWFAFRSVRMVVATFITLIAGLILTAGFAAVMVGQLNMITVAFGVLYIGLGVDFAIHMGLRYRELYEPKSLGNTAALRGTAFDIGPSLTLCAITTAVGFYSFIPTAYLGVSELGIISGSGMFVSLIITLTLLPALLSIWPFHPQKKQRRELPKGAPRYLTYLPLNHPSAIRRFSLIIGLAAICLLPWVHFNYDPLTLRDPECESIQTFRDLLKQSDTPPRSITIMATSAADVQKINSQLKTLPTVNKVLSIASFIPDHQNEKLIEIEDLQLILGPELEPATNQQPPTYTEQLNALDKFNQQVTTVLQSNLSIPWREQALAISASLSNLMQSLAEQPDMLSAQRIVVLEKGILESFPESIVTLQTSLNARGITIDTLPAEIRNRWISNDGTYRIEVYPKEDIGNGDALHQFVSEVRSVTNDVTGPPVVALESGRAVVGAFQQAFISALLVISLLLLAVLRSWTDTLLVIIPLLWAGIVTGALTVVLDIPFNFANIIALPLLLGIGVDNGIHVVHRMRSNNQTYAELLKSSTARGIYYSAITTIVSFLSLSFSAHPGTASMGVILTIGVLLTLFGTLLILPAIIAPSNKKTLAQE
jgi:uncharacterized protein